MMCIANHPNAIHASDYYLIQKNRVHNRQIHKANKLKGGKLKLNQAPHLVKSYRLNDTVCITDRLIRLAVEEVVDIFN